MMKAHFKFKDKNYFLLFNVQGKMALEETVELDKAVHTALGNNIQLDYNYAYLLGDSIKICDLKDDFQRSSFEFSMYKSDTNI